MIEAFEFGEGVYRCPECFALSRAKECGGCARREPEQPPDAAFIVASLEAEGITVLEYSVITQPARFRCEKGHTWSRKLNLAFVSTIYGCPICDKER
ncbi:hypothetical protein CUW27_20760 [Salmonella enterica]|nr:hypothetical protein [Salmonella enterica]